MPKYNSVEEIQEKRKEIAEKFDGRFPSYLEKYFDDKEKNKVTSAYFDSIRKIRRETSIEEDREFVKNRTEEFWKENKTEIVKKQKRTANPVPYAESPRNTQREEDERELTPEEVKVLINLCEKDLYLFAIRYFSHYLKKPSSELHRFFYTTLQKELNKKNRTEGFKWAVAAPRGNAKSSVVSSIFPVWCICYNKKKFIIMISKTSSLAEDFLTDIKAEFETNTKLMKDFPHVCGKGPRWRANEIITNNLVKVLALGTGSQIRGRKFGVHRPDLILCHKKGTKILYRDKWINIEEYPDAKTRISDGFEVKVWGLPFSETVTKEHRYFVKEDGWVEAKNLKLEHYIGYPIEYLKFRKYTISDYVFIKDGFLWSKVRSVTPIENEVFVPIKTEDSTYTTHFGRSHNCDDLEDPEMVRSDQTREFIRYTWFNKDVLFTAGEKGSVTDVFIVGTVLGKESLLNNILEPSEYPGWKTKRFKAVKNFSDSLLWDEWRKLYENRFDVDRAATARKYFEENKEEMLEGTEVLWPEGDPYYELMEVWVQDRGGFFCLDGNTDIVMGDYSYKKISDITVGDTVLSGTGVLETVTDTGISELCDRKVYDIKIVGHKDKIRVTEDHPFLIYPNIKYRKISLTHNHIDRLFTGNGNLAIEANRRILENKLIWKNASDLKVCDSVVFPLQTVKKSCLCHDPRWYWFVGLYLAEGCFTASDRAISLTMAKHERVYLETARDICKDYGYGSALTIYEYDNALVLTICSTKLVNRLKKYGRLSHNKHLTSEERGLCKECFNNLWSGYFIGDGYTTRNYHQANSTSIELLRNFQQLWYDFRVVSYLYNLRGNGTCRFREKEYNQRELYELVVVGNNSEGIRLSWIHNNILYSKIQSIEEVSVDNDYKTYWMSVSGNKTFCVPNAVVHNSEKQNSPIDVTKIYVTKDQLHWEWFNALPTQDILKHCHYFGAIDPSLGKKSRFGDYSCIVTIARDPKTGYIYVVAISMSRRSVDEQIAAVLRSHIKYNYKQFAIETNAFQLVMAQNLQKLSRSEGIYIPTVEIQNYTDKKMRIEGIVPLLIDGTIVFNEHKYRNVQEYNLGVDQLLTFTGEDSHDDFCILPGAFVQTKSGTKKIEDIELSDEVLTHTGKFRKVTKVFKRDYSGDIYILNNVLRTTPNHEIFVNETSFVPIKDININTMTIALEKIKSLEKSNYTGTVYNLGVEYDNSYVVNGITVHNCDALEMAVRIAKKPRFRMITSPNS